MRMAITAGASGIGLAMAAALSADGAEVHVCDVDPAALADLERSHPQIHGFAADVSQADQVDAFFASVARRGDLDVLVNNAGIAGPTARLEDIAEADWRRTLDVDLTGVFLATRRAIPLLRRSGRGGSIVNMASSAGLFGCPLRAPYVASKWAIVGLTKTLAMELGPERIRVNAICPGCVEGPRIRGVIERDAAARGLTAAQVDAEYKSQTSMRTFVDPEDVVAMLRFLISPAGAKISGQALGVDGHTESLSVRL